MDNQFPDTHNAEIRLFIILAIILCFILITSFIFSSKTQRKDNSVPTQIGTTPFEKVDIKAKSAYIYDIRTKTVLFAKNENTRLPLASLTKVMSTLVARDLSPLYGTVTITEEALSAEGESGLYRDERWSLKDLLDFSLVTSSNDGFRAVALSLGAISKAEATPEEIVDDFVGQMNRKAAELGLKNTHYWNETGLDQSELKGGAYGTTQDMTLLMEYILANHPELFSATRDTAKAFWSLDNQSHIAHNTNSITSLIPGLIASKTGFTETAGGNLVVAFDPDLGRPIIISLLGSTEQGRFQDMRVLIDAVMDYISH